MRVTLLLQLMTVAIAVLPGSALAQEGDAYGPGSNRDHLEPAGAVSRGTSGNILFVEGTGVVPAMQTIHEDTARLDGARLVQVVVDESVGGDAVTLENGTVLTVPVPVVGLGAGILRLRGYDQQQQGATRAVRRTVERVLTAVTPSMLVST